MTKDQIYTSVLILGALIMGLLWYNSYESQAYFYNQDIANREQLSLSFKAKFSNEKTYLLTQTHGSSTQFNVGKFDCCGAGGMVKDNQIYMGYLNTVAGTTLGTTTKQQIPEIDIGILTHELVHYVTLQPYVLKQCPSLSDRLLQEQIAYNAEHLYTQIKSLDEDGFIRLIK